MNSTHYHDSTTQYILAMVKLLDAHQALAKKYTQIKTKYTEGNF